MHISFWPLLVGIGLTILLAIKPLKISKISLDMAWGSLLVLLVLLLTQNLTPTDLYNGFWGNEDLQPWKVLVIFFSVAYVAISTDVTGIFDVIAHHIIQIAKGDIRKLFLFFYLFAAVLTTFTSNDIVILTLTPIIFYLGNHANLNVVPLLFAQFFGANTLSMMLLIGNPTNIIVSEALHLGFTEYFFVMFWPTVIAAVLNFLGLRWYFRKDLQHNFTLNEESKIAVRDYIDIGISAVILLAMLYTLALSDYLHWEIWKVTSVFCGISILHNAVVYAMNYTKEQRKKALNLPTRPNYFYMASSRMPWKIAPFVFTLFCLVSALSHTEFFIHAAAALAGLSQNLFSSIFVNGITSFFAANLLNNQPMSILFSSILLDENFSDNPYQTAAGYAVIISSNLGANLTLLGALAGLMWRSILQKKNLYVSYADFLKLGISITPVVLIATLAMLYLVFLMV